VLLDSNEEASWRVTTLSQPFMADDLTAIDPCIGLLTSLFCKLDLPVLLVIGFAIGSVTLANSASSAEQKR